MSKSKIVAIGAVPLVMGFQLAGLENSIQTTKENFQAELENALANKDYGIIIAGESMMENIDWRLKKRLDNIAYPIIVSLPEVGVESKQGDEIRNLIKRALGFDLAGK